jgi:hypothetical protein
MAILFSGDDVDNTEYNSLVHTLALRSEIESALVPHLNSAQRNNIESEEDR